MTDPARLVSGRFGLDGVSWTVHVDVDGTDPLSKASAYDPATGRHVLVDLVPDAAGTWTGAADGLELEVTGPDACRLVVDGQELGTLGRLLDAFRELRVDYAVCPGVTYQQAIDLAGFSTSEQGVMDLARALERAGIRTHLVRSSASPDPLAHSTDWDAAWDDAELHDAMVEHWLYAGVAGWNLWLMAAGVHEEGSGLAGLMFDGPGSPDEVQRQGVAAFSRAELHVPGDAVTGPESERNQMFTLVHEVGHALNLAHSWQKDEAVPEIPGAGAWMPLTSDPAARSWMNYPHAVAEFWGDFGYRFELDEVLFLRHAPEPNVMMGGKPFFVDHALNAQRQSLPLKVEIVGAPRFGPLEPVHLSVRVTHGGDRDLLALSEDATERSTGLEGRLLQAVLRTVVEEADGQLRVVRSYVHRLASNPRGALKPRSVAWADVFVGGEPGRGALFRDPGVYAVRVAVVLHGEVLGLSDPVEVVVEKPRRGDEAWARAARALRSEWGARLYRFEGSPTLLEARVEGLSLAEALDEAAADDPRLKLHQGRLLGGSYRRPRRRLRDGTVTVLEADREEAVQLLEAYLADRTSWEQSPAFCARVAVRHLRTLKELGDAGRSVQALAKRWLDHARTFGDPTLEAELRGFGPGAGQGSPAGPSGSGATEPGRPPWGLLLGLSVLTGALAVAGLLAGDASTVLDTGVAGWSSEGAGPPVRVKEPAGAVPTTAAWISDGLRDSTSHRFWLSLPAVRRGQQARLELELALAPGDRAEVVLAGRVLGSGSGRIVVRRGVTQLLRRPGTLEVHVTTPGWREAPIAVQGRLALAR